MTQTKAGTERGPAFAVAADPNPGGYVGWLLRRMRHLERENTRLRQEADRLYLLAFTPADRREYLLNRLDAAHDAMRDETTIDGALDAAWAAYLAGLDNVHQLHNTMRRQAA